MSHSAEKCERGDPLGFINIYSVAKYQKNSKGGLFWYIKKFLKKSRTMPRKKSKGGDPLVSSGFVGYGKIVKNERGDPFALISTDRTWPLMVVVLVVSIVRKVAQSEWDCSLTKKKGKKTSHCKSRALFLRKAPTKKQEGVNLLGKEKNIVTRESRNPTIFTTWRKTNNGKNLINLTVPKNLQQWATKTKI